MPRRLAQRMTLSDLKWSLDALHAISAAAELLAVKQCRIEVILRK